MHKSLTGLLITWYITIIGSSAFPQVPEKMSYQAVIRDNKEKPLMNQPVGIRFQVKQGSEFGAALYVESHAAVTDVNGFVHLEIGKGTQLLGSIDGIDWSAGPWYLQTETDPAGGTDYSIVGISELLSVPYAFHAKTADSLSGSFREADPLFRGSAAGKINAPDMIRWNGKIHSETQSLSDVLQQGNDSRGKSIKNIASPIDEQDAATKAYTDSLESRIDALEDMLALAGLYTIHETDSTSLPLVSTKDITGIYQHEAVSGGTMTPAGGPEVTAKGVCWNTQPSPDTGDARTYDGYGPAAFTSHLADLEAGTTYYLRAYALSRAGVAYGDELTFTTREELPYGSVTDTEGHAYTTIVIGTQEWMAENLKTAAYSNGDPIQQVTEVWSWSQLATGAWCDYRNDPGFSRVYGKLYNHYAVADVRNVCPAGWHVPAHDEWIVLQDYLGGWEIAGGKLKERGTVHWRDPNTGATNESGFTALPAPFRFESGNFVYEFSDYIGFCWSSTLSGRTLAMAWYWVNNSTGLNNYPFEKNRGYSVRCLKD